MQSNIQKHQHTPLEPPTCYHMSWGPLRQEMGAGDECFMHEGAIETAPSHDLAHLLVALSPRLTWKPEGTRDEVRIAEYNAVFLEHLLHNTFNAVARNNWASEEAFLRTLDYARWFVRHHFAPFPIPHEVAFSRFSSSLEACPTVDYSHLYFLQKTCEHTQRDYRDKVWNISFRVDQKPEIVGSTAQVFNTAVKVQMMRIKGSKSYRDLEMVG